MMSRSVLWWVLAALIVGRTCSNPVNEPLPLSLSELTSHLGLHPSRLQDARLSLPSVQDLENIKKVAQILVMLGQQVIPGIIGELPSSSTSGDIAPVKDQIPNDVVNVDKQNTT